MVSLGHNELKSIQLYYMHDTGRKESDESC